MESKKISFGFMKTKKQEKPGIVEKREYIDCVEEKSIKVIGGEAVKDESPLVILMKPNTLVTAERLKQIAEKVESALEEPEPEKKEEPVEEVPPENETLEQMAMRELLQEAKKEKVVEQPTLLVPLPAKPVMDGEKESTLDDYESVPIQEFGLAMLRGMGWKPGQEQSKYKQPQLRPKGLGLGADKVVKENQKKNNSKDKEEELAIVKGSYVKVTAGKYNGYYGKVVSLDEDNGRVMIEIAVKKETVSLSEFMMQAVTKSEFDKQSKVINADSYAEYKKNENDSQKISNQENSKNRESVSSHKSNDISKRDRERREYKEEDRSREIRDSDKYSNGRNKDKEDRLKSHRSRNNSSSDENESHRNKQKDKKRYSSNESLSTDSEKKYRGKKKRHSSTSSNASSEEEYRRRHKSKSSKNSKEKRDIDKKRKGKKKKRDRDRSPNYRKHKK